MKNRKNIIFLIISSFWFLSLLFFAPVSAQVAEAAEPQILTADEIEKRAIVFLERALPWEKESLEIDVYYQGKDITLPPGKKELIYKIMGSSQRAGRIPMFLEIRINDHFQKRIQFSTKVLVSQKVVKTIRPVRRGEVLSNEEIKMETIQTDRPLPNAITNIDYALGYEAARNLSIGKILIPNFLKRPALGNRGDKILIKAQKGGMTITAPGILKEDGYEDAMVRVLNLESKKVIYGRLVDSNTVKVSF